MDGSAIFEGQEKQWLPNVGDMLHFLLMYWI
jgi:hypothetical protein